MLTPNNKLNGNLAGAVALIHRRIGTPQEFAEVLVPVADAILARLSLTADELAVVLVADRHRHRPANTVAGPPPPTPEDDQLVAEAAAARAVAELADRAAFDQRLIADAGAAAALRQGKEPSARVLGRQAAAMEEWKAARAVLEKAIVRCMEAERARNYRRAALA